MLPVLPVLVPEVVGVDAGDQEGGNANTGREMRVSTNPGGWHLSWVSESKELPVSLSSAKCPRKTSSSDITRGALTAKPKLCIPDVQSMLQALLAAILNAPMPPAVPRTTVASDSSRIRLKKRIHRQRSTKLALVSRFRTRKVELFRMEENSALGTKRRVMSY